MRLFLFIARNQSCVHTRENGSSDNFPSCAGYRFRVQIHAPARRDWPRRTEDNRTRTLRPSVRCRS